MRGVPDDGAATYEAKVGDGLLHADTGGLGDPVRVVEDVGHGAGGGAGPSGDVDELRAVVASGACRRWPRKTYVLS